MRPPRPRKGELRRGEVVAFGSEAPPKPRLRVIAWRPLRKNTLLGFVSIELASGLQIIDCTVHRSSGRLWIGMPAKPQIDSEGRQKRDPNTGKPSFTSVNQWRDRETSDRFSELVITLLRERYPDELDGDLL
jgi:hypothetical protein